MEQTGRSIMTVPEIVQAIEQRTEEFRKQLISDVQATVVSIRAGTPEAFDYDPDDREAVIKHLESEFNRWWERTGRDADPYSVYTFGETVWLAAHGIER